MASTPVLALAARAARREKLGGPRPENVKKTVCFPLGNRQNAWKNEKKKVGWSASTGKAKIRALLAHGRAQQISQALKVFWGDLGRFWIFFEKTTQRPRRGVRSSLTWSCTTLGAWTRMVAATWADSPTLAGAALDTPDPCA